MRTVQIAEIKVVLLALLTLPAVYAEKAAISEPSVDVAGAFKSFILFINGLFSRILNSLYYSIVAGTSDPCLGLLSAVEGLLSRVVGLLRKLSNFISVIKLGQTSNH